MSLNTWTPENQLAKNTPDAVTVSLQEYIQIGASPDIAEAVSRLPAAEIEKLTPLMKQASEFWHTAADTLAQAEIIHLIRFFTLAEEKHSQLFAGKQSPVIALNRLLKNRNTPLPKEELLWIKANSSNRFLPNGSVL